MVEAVVLGVSWPCGEELPVSWRPAWLHAVGRHHVCLQSYITSRYYLFSRVIPDTQCLIFTSIVQCWIEKSHYL